MTLATLIATEADFGSEVAFLASVLERYNEELTPADGITGMFLAGARADLALDLPRVTGLLTTDAMYDRSITDSEAAWRYLLSRRQLAVIYDWLDEGEGSLNRVRAKRYATEYRDALAGIGAVMRTGAGSIARTVTVRL